MEATKTNIYFFKSAASKNLDAPCGSSWILLFLLWLVLDSDHPEDDVFYYWSLIKSMFELIILIFLFEQTPIKYKKYTWRPAIVYLMNSFIQGLSTVTKYPEQLTY